MMINNCQLSNKYANADTKIFMYTFRSYSLEFLFFGETASNQEKLGRKLVHLIDYALCKLQSSFPCNSSFIFIFLQFLRFTLLRVFLIFFLGICGLKIFNFTQFLKTNCMCMTVCGT